MRSSTGQHYLALDHLRALAAFLVFAWHFTHAAHGYPVPFDQTPFAFPPFSLLDEGHTGVALFMTLSGYLFAKLLGHQQIDYKFFMLNRALRLLPLLVVVIVVVGAIQFSQGTLVPYLKSIAQGVLMPSLPNGGWSITVEFHFYLLLPALLFLARKSIHYLVAIVVGAVLFRLLCHTLTGSVQELAYWTLVGRIDQFVLGMLSAYTFAAFRNKGLLVLAATTGLVGFYTWFDAAGGFYGLPSYPSPSLTWVILPTIEGLAYAAIIGGYDAWQQSTNLLSRAIGKVGEYSYSIYLLHVFVVFHAADLVHTRVMDISNFYLAVAWAVPAFVLMALACACSYHWIELPFLRYRRSYVRST